MRKVRQVQQEPQTLRDIHVYRVHTVSLASPDLDLAGHVWSGRDLEDALSGVRATVSPSSTSLTGKGFSGKVVYHPDEPRDRRDVWARQEFERRERTEVTL